MAARSAFATPVQELHALSVPAAHAEADEVMLRGTMPAGSTALLQPIHQLVVSHSFTSIMPAQDMPLAACTNRKF